MLHPLAHHELPVHFGLVDEHAPGPGRRLHGVGARLVGAQQAAGDIIDPHPGRAVMRGLDAEFLAEKTQGEAGAGGRRRLCRDDQIGLQGVKFPADHIIYKPRKVKRAAPIGKQLDTLTAYARERRLKSVQLLNSGELVFNIHVVNGCERFRAAFCRKKHIRTISEHTAVNVPHPVQSRRQIGCPALRRPLKLEHC